MKISHCNFLFIYKFHLMSMIHHVLSLLVYHFATYLTIKKILIIIYLTNSTPSKFEYSINLIHFILLHYFNSIPMNLMVMAYLQQYLLEVYVDFSYSHLQLT